jgi:hypothetical protein
MAILKARKHVWGTIGSMATYRHPSVIATERLAKVSQATYTRDKRTIDRLYAKYGLWGILMLLDECITAEKYGDVDQEQWLLDRWLYREG